MHRVIIVIDIFNNYRMMGANREKSRIHFSGGQDSRPASSDKTLRTIKARVYHRDY
ncbi:hypothetical protein KPK_A0123 (plasmid) [Klebsiella variicola]|uniref:Uncharacterized protein n=1 Tax=Klebsiella variicola (strain 342) TaxID=507522 RepID=B5RK47_KLEV3|nr:hypothetical protein KPK_A0123 [Klebsiella variicola]